MSRTEVLDQINSAIGPVVIRLVDLKNEIAILGERLAGALQPNVAEYQAALGERQREYNALETQLRELRKQLIAAYERDLNIMEMEKQNTLDPFTIEELSWLQQQVRTKIDQLKKLVDEN
ncbi:MAG: hypothetical protein ACK5DD_10290 [Cyclobacteriaceae bacterium]|jgi:hypothetical protein